MFQSLLRENAFMNEFVHCHTMDRPALTSLQVEDIQHFIAPGEAPPSMILNRTDDEDGLRLPSSTTRASSLLHTLWGSVLTSISGLFGYDGIILEATESAQVVAVMLF